MSLFPLHTTSTMLPPVGQMPSVVECHGRNCYHNEIELPIIDDTQNTTFLKIVETVISIIVLLANLLLFFILNFGKKRFAAAFFKILNALIVIIIIRTLSTVVLKLPALWFGALIVDGTIVSLAIDLFSKYISILLIFLLSLNRFSVIVYSALDNALFSGKRYIFLCLVCIIMSAAITYGVITASNLRRLYEPRIGFVDYIDSDTFYEASCIVFLSIATISVCLHLMIVFYLRCYTVRLATSKRSTMEQKMLREVAMISVINMSFTVLFIILNIVPTSFEIQLFLISFYNIMCTIPDVLIPLFVLIGSGDVRLEILSRWRRMQAFTKFSDSSTSTIRPSAFLISSLWNRTN